MMILSIIQVKLFLPMSYCFKYITSFSIKSSFILKRKAKGGILYYSLLVLILSSSAVSLILLLNYYDNKNLINSIKLDDLKRNVNSSINLFLEGEDIFKNSDSTTVDLYNDSTSKVVLVKKKWGNYTVVFSKANWRNITYSKEALIGSYLWTREPIALFLTDQQQVLSLSGNTILKGTCYLPDKNARKASIEGQQYIYRDIVFGEIKKSPNSLPEIDSDLLSFPESYLSSSKFTNDSIINMQYYDSNSIENSFKSKTILVFNDNIRDLSNYSFKGNIVIWSTLPIEIDSSTELKDVILFAPKIVVKSGFTGELQAYAVQSIRIEENCHLGFPSQICVLQVENCKYNPTDSLAVSIGKGSTVEGGVLIKNSGLTSIIKMEEGSKIIGQIYCKGLVEIKGDIIGSLFCNSFYLENSKAKYYNHLLNCRIDFTSLSKNFVGIDLIEEIQCKSVLKWLN